MNHLKKWVWLILLVMVIAPGCSKRIQPEPTVGDDKNPKRIAVLPVINRTTEVPAGRILRERAIEELYLKGYPKISSKTVDEKLAKLYKEGALIPPSVAGKLLDVDAVLYCTLTEWKTSVVLAYGVISAKAKFELRSVSTGEVLWKATKDVTKRSLHPLRKEVEILTLLDYEPAIHELVNNAVDAIPNGPQFIAKGPPKRGFFQEWF